MERIVTGVTLQTLPEAVRRAGLKPGQRFTITVEDEPVDRAAAVSALRAISERVGARVEAAGLSEDDVMRLLEDEDDEARAAT
ncbi:hypothetical protein [Nitrospirillum iridis]|uniref:Bifunctional DNA-binding transcriptional regulator/antitoxin component of YhaV-PrlF toxin-antitoxin module n=1 Tax=Nitrospirillum iridis TaxID=765888 RepID=A0A7X0EFS0_9PROT|nr:hypothetical protein [Nitrospirillum iridis]MBB6255298.1 bifunctional DNA-binding transcriptional regulator/antitoxin component of YhaV-PrlF toxin-antitoxin module [Nitrospirillum iridis]